MISYMAGDNRAIRQYICRECNTEYARKYRKTEAGIQATRKAVRKYEKTHPKRKLAWNKANKIKRKPCEVCGNPQTHRHHPDILNPLVVKHLCPLHHKQSHKITV